MNDPGLKRLVIALDSATQWAANHDVPDLHGDIEIAHMRLQCLKRLLGNGVTASPYLAFIERLCANAPAPGRQAVAAGA
jgi:hypothetical protein